MCGRYTLAVEYEELIEAFGVPFNPHLAEVYRPRYNIAPTDGVLILREKQHLPELIPARFGLVNHWAKDLSGAARQLNARAETVREKPAFRDAFVSRRCVVPANGFYEWQGEGKAKVPFWLHPPNEKFCDWRDSMKRGAIRSRALR
ncbi:MAG: SOS response-associated peptidase [Polyangiaceae bacterium]|nr:SOS response-associated peptidase [Polyangiaceae bacterium]